MRPALRTAAAKLLAVALAAVAAACASTPRAPVAHTVGELESAVDALRRPLPGDLTALYKLRVPSSGGLRLLVQAQRGGEGRLTVSEPFGSAVTITAWGDGPPRLYDLRNGCAVEATDIAAVFGLGTLPLPQAVELLGGRFPAAATDTVTVADPARGTADVAGAGWAATVVLRADPWRVVEVRSASSGWRIRLGEHTSSQPGSARIDGPDGDWAELELVELAWDALPAFPPPPALPPCGKENR